RPGHRDRARDPGRRDERGGGRDPGRSRTGGDDRAVGHDTLRRREDSFASELIDVHTREKEPGMLSMSGIKKVYRTDLVETHALSEFTLDVPAGEFVAIMGPSGSGKTTFLNVAGLLDTFNDGSYRLDGHDVSRLSDSEMSRIRNRKIGFVFQSFN